MRGAELGQLGQAGVEARPAKRGEVGIVGGPKLGLRRKHCPIDLCLALTGRYDEVSEPGRLVMTVPGDVVTAITLTTAPGIPRQPAHRLPLPAATAHRHRPISPHPIGPEDRRGHQLAAAPDRGPQPPPAAATRRPARPLLPARPPRRARDQLRQDDDQAHRAARTGRLARPRRGRRPARTAHLRHRDPPGSGRRHRRAHAALSSGPVEGNVNRLKAIKRQMYGRASLDLLRKRVIHHPP